MIKNNVIRYIYVHKRLSHLEFFSEIERLDQRIWWFHGILNISSKRMPPAVFPLAYNTDSVISPSWQDQASCSVVLHICCSFIPGALYLSVFVRILYIRGWWAESASYFSFYLQRWAQCLEAEGHSVSIQWMKEMCSLSPGEFSPCICWRLGAFNKC